MQVLKRRATAAAPPAGDTYTIPNTYSFWSPESLGEEIRANPPSTVFMASTLAVANLIRYVPLILPVEVTITGLWHTIGASVPTGNVDLGVYDENFARLLSTGSTAILATANTMQHIAHADTAIGPGLVYLASQYSLSTDRCLGAQVVLLTNTYFNLFRAAGCYEEAAASFGLPAMGTPAALTNAHVIPLAGITTGRFSA